MATARVFSFGNSQAIRLPKQFRFDAREVEIFRRGDEIVLKAKPKDMASAFHLLAGMPDDVFAEGVSIRHLRRGLASEVACALPVQ